MDIEQKECPHYYFCSRNNVILLPSISAEVCACLTNNHLFFPKLSEETDKNE